MRESQSAAEQFAAGVRAAQPFALAILGIGFRDQYREIEQVINQYSRLDEDAPWICAPNGELNDDAYAAVSEHGLAALRLGVALGLMLRPEMFGGAQ